MQHDLNRVVITGIGPIGSVGIGKKDFWAGVLQKNTNVVREKSFVGNDVWGDFYSHVVPNFLISNFGIDKEKLQDIKEWKEGEEIIDLNYLIAAIKLALDDSNLSSDCDKSGIGLVLAHENLNLMPFTQKMSEAAYKIIDENRKEKINKKDFFAQVYKEVFKCGYDTQAFANLFHVARVFNIHDYSLFINNACASGLYALETANQIVKCGQAKIVVVAASDHSEIYKYLWFRDLGLYSPDGIIRPFCKDSNGLVFGDGGVALVMETLENARNRGADIYAEYCGGGFNLEGWKITVPQIGSQSYQNAIMSALSRSNVTKEEIDFVCPHGVGSGPIDYYEAKALTDVFGGSLRRPLLSAFKPYVGHNLGGSALLETAILLLSLHYNCIPPTLNSQNVDPRFKISLAQEQIRMEMTTVMKTCCAFAGFNGAAVFKKIK